MFKRIAPQRAQDSAGFLVQIGSRYSVQYLEGDLVVEMEVDFGPTTTIYPDRLTIQKKGQVVELPADQRATIVDRMEEGLKCLGVKYEAHS
jgi:hypothetical protein